MVASMSNDCLGDNLRLKLVRPRAPRIEQAIGDVMEA
jgi:hypothetical protein